MIFIFFQNFEIVAGRSDVLRFGYGAYTSVDWALATDVLPPTDEAGKDLGIWSAAGGLPQVIGVVLGGSLMYVLRARRTILATPRSSPSQRSSSCSALCSSAR